MNRYDDIIHLPHYEPRHHPRMPLSERAAQFSPFAALKSSKEEEGKEKEDDVDLIELFAKLTIL